MPKLACLPLACALCLLASGCGDPKSKRAQASGGAKLAADGGAGAGEAARDAKLDAPLPKPANGSPVAVEFLEWTGEDAGRGMRVRVYNHGAVTTVGLTVVIRYYDERDELLLVKEGSTLENDNDFGTVVGDAYACEPKRGASFAIDGRALAVPPAAKRAELAVSKVYWSDPESGMIEGLWTQTNFTEWPGDKPYEWKGPVTDR